MLNKASPVILPKSKSFDFWISKPPNIPKFKGTFKVNHFGNRFLFNIGFPPWLSSKETK